MEKGPAVTARYDPTGGHGQATVSDFGVLGRDAGGYGRVARLFIGVWLVIEGMLLLAALGHTGHHNGHSLASIAEITLGDLIQVTLYIVATVSFYTLLLWLIGDRVIARLNPWSNTTLLLLPSILAISAGFLRLAPTTLVDSQFLYIGISLIVISMSGYGGCEIVGVPVLVLRRRYTVACAWNAIDVVERPLGRGRSSLLRVLSGLLAVAAGVYFFVLQPVLGLISGNVASSLAVLGAHPSWPDRWLAVLFLPAIITLTVGWGSAYRRGQGSTTQAHADAIGALALTAMLLSVIVSGSVWDFYYLLTAGILGAGIIVGIRQALTSLHSHDTSSDHKKILS